MEDSRTKRIVVAGAVVRDGKLLAARRTSPSALAGRWELPGGKVDPGESPQAALTRELHEELGVDVTVGERLPGEVELGQGLVLCAWLARLERGEPRPLQDHDQVRWVDVREAPNVDWLEQDRPFVAQAARYLD
ncbi:MULTISPECIES: (deoxy)nucleoside triphosphate pyrophosphohydrolase [Streptomyces]|uniref:8-oxo-dGTP diphosphatase n=1 Tax=Streptomyces cacaoi TaxID=1898 RepID=A0A4Y3R878_STRCI|nr:MULTISPECIES: (deoxy)nucleoside triphosphate pyrophosphohydrolase [Streptomyces]NNG88488.1 (deoxy)nucleoside triphosphate pyrophosphohydrolase [Streptomyces cacaoi]QHF97839.1 (deoxy)nucleoside triphosphate pyrophosphohydrolase [Streptomyces sp. NHF165]GEB52050.1 DNA mismatch repair protein MutT [Streptomyces cacaoi]